MRKKMSFKNSVGLLCAILLFMSSGVLANGADLGAIEYEDIYESVLRNDYIRTCSASISISGTTATSTGVCSKYTNVSGDVSIYVYLQKQSGNDWIIVDSTNESFTSTTGIKTLTTEGLEKGTYRARVSCWVNGENVIVNSASKTIP